MFCPMSCTTVSIFGCAGEHDDRESEFLFAIVHLFGTLSPLPSSFIYNVLIALLVFFPPTRIFNVHGSIDINKFAGW